MEQTLATIIEEKTQIDQVVNLPIMHVIFLKFKAYPYGIGN